MNARIHSAIADSRGQTREPCDECGGSGVLRVAAWDPSEDYDESCAWCIGTGHVVGFCDCGARTTYLVPDGARNEDGTCPGSVLVCQKCAVTCYGRGCGLVSTVCDAETREQYCDEHWAREEREYAAQCSVMN